MKNDTIIGAFIKKYSLVLILLAFVLVGLSISQFLKLREFRIVGTTPSLRDMSYVSPFLKVNFNKVLSEKDLDVTASPDIIDEVHITGKTLYITTNRMDPSKPYVITIRHIEDQQGKAIRNKSIEFTTTDDQELSKEQQEALTQLQDKKKAVSVDPILAHVPHNTLRYRMSPLQTSVDKKNVVILQVQLIIPPQIAGTNQETVVVEQYKQEALNYIKSLNLDPAQYTIQYEVISANLDSTRGGEL